LLREKKPDRVVAKLPGPCGNLVVKAQFADNYKPILRSLYGRAKGRKEWENHLVALACGIPVVRPLAYGELRTFGAVRECVIITQWELDVMSLKAWRGAAADQAGGEMACRIAAKLGELTAQMQHHGIYHNEISSNNVLIRTTANGPGLLMIDWKHARLKRRCPRNDLQNLLRTGSFLARSRRAAPAADSAKKAFLRAYFRAVANRPGSLEVLEKLKRTCPVARTLEWSSPDDGPALLS